MFWCICVQRQPRRARSCHPIRREGSGHLDATPIRAPNCRVPPAPAHVICHESLLYNMLLLLMMGNIDTLFAHIYSNMYSLASSLPKSYYKLIPKKVYKMPKSLYKLNWTSIELVTFTVAKCNRVNKIPCFYHTCTGGGVSNPPPPSRRKNV